jgi:hypothetical protein
MTEVAQFWATFFNAKFPYLPKIDQNGFGYILGDFAKTHLVTLTMADHVTNEP